MILAPTGLNEIAQRRRSNAKMVTAPQYQAAAQSSRHIPCAVLRIESVSHRPVADGTAECAFYFGLSPKVVGTFHVPFLGQNQLCIDLWLTAQLHQTCSWFGNSPPTFEPSSLGLTDYRNPSGEDRIRTCGKELTLRRISNPVL
jgi:hypothetical protein